MACYIHWTYRLFATVEELLPWLYTKGISTGDFSVALSTFLGPEAEGLSASTISRLKKAWWDELQDWSKRDLSTKRYVYLWADGVYFTPCLDGDRQSVLVIIGADEYGEKDVLAIEDGFRENADSWRDFLRSLKKRGLTTEPELAIDDGAFGFWTAQQDIYPEGKNSGAGFIRRPASSECCPSRCKTRPRQICRTSGWPRRRRKPRLPLIFSLKLIHRAVKPRASGRGYKAQPH